MVKIGSLAKTCLIITYCKYLCLNFNLITDSTCFETGNYLGEYDIVKNINDAESCQNLCQEHSQCKFWTWDKTVKTCKPQTDDSLGVGTSEYHIRGPRSCPGKSLNISTYLLLSYS